MKKAEAVAHHLNGLEAWKTDAFGILHGWRWYVFLFLITSVILVSIIVPWSFSIPFSGLVALVFVGMPCGLVYLKRRSRRSLRMKNQLHLIAHHIRDFYVDLNAAQTSPSINPVSNHLCELIQKYFEILTQKPDSKIGVAIRHINRDLAYETVGRAGALSPGRASTSEVLPHNQGLAKFFSHKDGKQGAIIINDIDRAEEAGIYVKLGNDDTYSKEIASMIVAPINGWDGKGKGLLGILYVTSREHRTFKERDIDAVAFVADSLANVYSEMFSHKRNVSKDLPNDRAPETFRP